MKILNDSEVSKVVGGLSVVATVGILSPNGSHTVTAPESATPGLLNAFTNVVTKGPGDLANIDISFVK